MKKFDKHIVYMLMIIVSSVVLVIALAWGGLKPVTEKNGFNRNYVDNYLTSQNVVSKKVDIIDIIGNTSEHIYFSTKNPNRLVMSDKALGKIKSISLDFVSKEMMESSFNTIVDSPVIVVLAKNIPAIIWGREDSKARINKLPSSLFTRAIMIGENSLIIRGFDTSVKTPDQIFYKLNTSNGQIYREQGVSEKNMDAGISTDGLLLYDKYSGIVNYIFYYRSGFICLDTNLNILYKGNTLDTIKSQVKGDVVGNNIITNVTPKRIINLTSAVSNGFLYNSSKLKADNESADVFRKNSSIDVYDILRNKYVASFYIPNYKNERMKKFKIVNDCIITLYEHYIIAYKIKNSLLNNHLGK